LQNPWHASNVSDLVVLQEKTPASYDYFFLLLLFYFLVFSFPSRHLVLIGREGNGVVSEDVVHLGNVVGFKVSLPGFLLFLLLLLWGCIGSWVRECFVLRRVTAALPSLNLPCLLLFLSVSVFQILARSFLGLR